jgi:hypothetical protein
MDSNIFGFTFNVERPQITIQKGQTVIIDEWNWKRFKFVSKAITMQDDGNIKVTYLE